MPWWNDIFKSKKAYKACQNDDVLGNNVVVVERVSDGKKLVRKVVFLQNSKDKADVEKEFERLRKVDHPNIVRYEDFDIESTPNLEIAMLYMEMCEAGTLHKYIRDEASRITLSRKKLESVGSRPKDSADQLLRLSPIVGGAGLLESVVWDWIMQITSALVYCHYGIKDLDRNLGKPLVPQNTRIILHRDLKPDNIFLSPVGQSGDVILKLGDFGHSVDLQGPSVSYRTWRTGDYVAPEIRTGGGDVKWTDKCDIYSCGCIIYFMCTGGDPDQLYKRPRQVLITDIPADYTTELRGLVADCCANDFNTRPNAWQLYTKAKEASVQAYL